MPFIYTSNSLNNHPKGSFLDLNLLVIFHPLLLSILISTILIYVVSIGQGSLDVAFAEILELKLDLFGAALAIDSSLKAKQCQTITIFVVIFQPNVLKINILINKHFLPFVLIFLLFKLGTGSILFF